MKSRHLKAAAFLASSKAICMNDGEELLRLRRFSNKHDDEENLHAQISDVHRAIHCLQRLEDQEKAAQHQHLCQQLCHDESQVEN